MTPAGRQLAVLGALLFTASVALYAHVVGFPFVLLDDYQYVLDVPMVRDGFQWSDVPWAFGSYTRASNWHPLTWLSYAFDAELWGVDPRGFHATNLVLHGLNAVLVLVFVHVATGSVWRAAAVAAVFALHPLRVESVAWVSERKDLLSGAFGLLALLAYVGWVRRGGLARYSVVALCLFASLASKSMLVTLPFVLLLLDWWPLDRVRAGAWPRLVIEKLPLFAISIAVSALTIVSQQSRDAVAVGATIALPLRLANSAMSYVRYTAKTLWPSDLIVFYPHPNLPGGVPWSVWQIAGALLLVAGSLAAVVVWRRERWLAVGWLWFLGTLVPVIGWVQAGHQAMADRYTYFPSIGLAIVLVFGATRAAERLAATAGERRPERHAVDVDQGEPCVGRVRQQQVLSVEIGRIHARIVQRGQGATDAREQAPPLGAGRCGAERVDHVAPVRDRGRHQQALEPGPGAAALADRQRPDAGDPPVRQRVRDLGLASGLRASQSRAQADADPGAQIALEVEVLARGPGHVPDLADPGPLEPRGASRRVSPEQRGDGPLEAVAELRRELPVGARHLCALGPHPASGPRRAGSGEADGCRVGMALGWPPPGEDIGSAARPTAGGEGFRAGG